MKFLRWIRFLIALWAGKFFLFLYCHTGHVRNDKPGMASMRLDSQFLYRVAKPKLTIVVTGTNGKTTVSGLVADSLRHLGYTVSFNDWGANHHAGIARCLLDTVNIFNRSTKDAAVLEVDELISPEDVPALQPSFIIVTNLARDSMLRNAHPDYIAQRLGNALRGAPNATVILNANDPLSCFLGETNRRLYFAVSDQHTGAMPNRAQDFSVCPVCGGLPQYEYRNYRHIGKFYCPTCGLTPPEPDYFVQRLDWQEHRLIMREADGVHNYPMPLCSLHNAYNLSPVIALLRQLGNSPSVTAETVAGLRVLCSRESCESIRGINIKTLVAKGQNPTASSTVFEIVAKDPSEKDVILLLDERYETPLKTETVAWLYDTDFEFLNQPNIHHIILGGARYLDHRLRLLLAGVPEEKLICVRNEMDTANYVSTEGIATLYILHDVNAISLSRQVLRAAEQHIKEAHHED